ncbi:MAG: hypothetical protein ACQESG_07600, partial [Nanobdellota archaeon]
TGVCYSDINITQIYKGWNYTCEAQADDGVDLSDTVNSTTVVVGNTIPAIALIEPAHNANISNGSDLTNRTPLLRWNSSDIDGDTLRFEINISCYPSCSDDDRIYTLNVSNYTNEGINYSWSLIPELEYLWDGKWTVEEYYYTWQARAFDGSGYSGWSDPYNFSVASLVQFELQPDTVNFGDADLWESMDTYTGYAPIVIINDGNVHTNVSMKTTQYLWDSVAAGTRYFQFRVDENETDSFNTSMSVMSWTNVTLTNLSIIHSLDYHASSDSAELHFNVTVPPAEPKGAKQANFTISGRALFE